VDAAHRKSFRHTAATLRALADLAEFASMRCLPIRILVLWILRPAEAVACAYAIELGIPAWQLAIPSGSTPDDALHLAGNLRALADAFDALACMLVLPPLATALRRANLRIRMSDAFLARPFLVDTS
jgi:hypothetical protein